MNALPPAFISGVRRILASRSFRLCVGAALLIVLAQRVNMDAAWKALRQLSLLNVAAALALIYTMQLLASARWLLLLRMHEVVISLWLAVQLNFLGLFTSCFLPGSIGGDAVKITVLTRKTGRLARILAASLLDRLINTLVVTMMALIMLPQIAILIPFAPQWPSRTGLALGIALAGLAGVSAMVAWRALPVLQSRGLLPASLYTRLLQARTALSSWRLQPGIFLAAGALSLAMLLVATATSYLLLAGLGSELRYSQVLVVLLAVHFVNILPISLNGIGVTEVSLVFLLSRLGVDTGTATAYAVLARVLFMLAVTPGSLASLPGRQHASQGSITPM